MSANANQVWLGGRFFNVVDETGSLWTVRFLAARLRETRLFAWQGTRYADEQSGWAPRDPKTYHAVLSSLVCRPR